MYQHVLTESYDLANVVYIVLVVSWEICKEAVCYSEAADRAEMKFEMWMVVVVVQGVDEVS